MKAESARVNGIASKSTRVDMISSSSQMSSPAHRQDLGILSEAQALPDREGLDTLRTFFTILQEWDEAAADGQSPQQHESAQGARIALIRYHQSTEQR